MLAIFHICIFIGAILGLSVALRLQFLPDAPLFHPLHACITLYVAVNIMICLWEISLFLHRDLIQFKYNAHRKVVKVGCLPSPLFLFQSIGFSQAFGFEFWAEVWATYSLLDESYAQTGSFGFNIDVGNGFSTLLPNALFLLGMNNALPTWMEPRMVGFVSVLFFYQAMYGTFVYFFQYVMNARWEVHATSNFWPLVLSTNGFWIVGPMACIFACWKMVEENSLMVFHA